MSRNEWLKVMGSVADSLEVDIVELFISNVRTCHITFVKNGEYDHHIIYFTNSDSPTLVGTMIEAILHPRVG